MIIRPYVIGMLLANGPVQQKVGGTRVYPDKLPQKAPRPALVVHQVGGGHLKGLKGRTGQGRPRVMVWCCGDTGDDANALAQVVSDFLDGYRGASVPGGPAILGCFEEDASDEYTPPVHGDDAGVHATPLQFLVVHGE